MYDKVYEWKREEVYLFVLEMNDTQIWHAWRDQGHQPSQAVLPTSAHMLPPTYAETQSPPRIPNCGMRLMYPILVSYIKGIVQREVRGVESRLKRSVLINCLVALVHFLN